MIQRKILMTVFGLALTFRVGAEVSIVQAFSDLYSMIEATNVVQNAFLEAISIGSNDWTNQYALARRKLADQALSDWFCELSESSATNLADYAERTSWIHAKAVAMRELSSDFAVRNDTNCWFAVARNHGLTRSRIHTDAQLDEMRGAISRSVGNDGVSIIVIPDLFSEESARRHAQVEELERIEELDREYLSDIMPIFSLIAHSETFSSFESDERNAVVSNIVATARLTPVEASALGMTNILVEANCPGGGD